MILTLEVTGSQAAKLDGARRKTFNATGGTIGRLRDNDWSLPDPYVSSRHAIVRFANGAFSIEDTSTNGVFINRADNRLVKGQPYRIKDNDLIFIEPYEIRATLDEGAAQAVPFSGADDPFSLPGRPQSSSSAAYSSAPLIPSNDFDSGDEVVDPLAALGFGGAKPKSAPAPSANDLRGASVLQEHFRPPEVIPSPPPRPAPPSGGLIPDDYDPFDDRQSVPTPPSTPPPPVVQKPQRAEPPPIPDDDAWPQPSVPARSEPPASEPRVSSDVPVRPSPSSRLGPRSTHGPAAAAAQPATDSIARLLKGAGIDPAAMTPDLAEDFGRIIRLVVAGTMDVLQARQELKRQFRMDMTTFRPAENNPLKFSANVDDALHNLLVKRNAAFLNPAEAFEDAFGDIRNHQMAMLTGMRVAFEAMLAEFDPSRLQEEFDRQLKSGGILAVPARMRYWDLYATKFRDMVRDADAAFRELFGDEFATAYEEQLKRLKPRSRGNNEQ